MVFFRYTKKQHFREKIFVMVSRSDPIPFSIERGTKSPTIKEAFTQEAREAYVLKDLWQKQKKLSYFVKKIYCKIFNGKLKF